MAGKPPKKTGSKGKKLFRLESGTLGRFGYENVKSMSMSERRIALKRALTNMKPLSVYRKINALAILNRNTDPLMEKILLSDKKWIEKTSEYQNRNN